MKRTSINMSSCNFVIFGHMGMCWVNKIVNGAYKAAINTSNTIVAGELVTTAAATTTTASATPYLEALFIY